MTSICTYPGCRKPLYNRNKTGLCSDHTHAYGFCRCSQCDPASRRPPPPIRMRPPAPPEPEPEPEPELLVPDPKVASIAELCAPLSAKVKSRHRYNWAGGVIFTMRGD